MRIDPHPDRRHAPPSRPARQGCTVIWVWLLAATGCASVGTDPPAQRTAVEQPPAVDRTDAARDPSSPGAQARAEPPEAAPVRVDSPGVLLSDPALALAANEGPSPDPALAVAAYEGDLARVRALLQNGVNVEASDRYGGTPLMAALRKFSAESKANGARAGPTEKDKQRAARKLRIARSLVERGASVNATDRLGHTPLHFAAMAAGEEREVVAVIDLLVARGAEINRRTDERFGRTPLEYAIDQGAVGRVQRLLQHGADASVMTAEGKSLEAVAEERGYAAIAQLLRAAAPR